MVKGWFARNRKRKRLGIGNGVGVRLLANSIEHAYNTPTGVCLQKMKMFLQKWKLILVCCTLAITAYWAGTLFIKNVYDFALVGAVYEILWLPMLASLVALPVLAFVFWVKERFSIKSVYPYLILLIITLFLMLIFLK